MFQCQTQRQNVLWKSQKIMDICNERFFQKGIQNIKNNDNIGSNTK